jgi:hypothetical protein
MNINIFKQNNKFYFNEDKFYNKKQDLVKAITRELGYPHKEALKYVNNKLGKPTSKKDKEEYYKNKIMMLERRVAYLEDKLNEKEIKPIVSCEVSKPKIEWVKPEPIKEEINCNEELKNSQNKLNTSMNETKRLLALLEEHNTEKQSLEEEKKELKILSFEEMSKLVEEEPEELEDEDEEEELEIDKEIDLNEIFTDEDTDEEEEEEEKEKISNNNIDMTQPIMNVNKDNLEKITLRNSDTNKLQHFYKYILREEGKEDKLIILTKLLQKVGVCKLWIDKNIDEEFRDEEDCINYEGEELYEIIITVPELCRLDKSIFREFKYNKHYNNLTETNEYFNNWLSKEDFNNIIEAQYKEYKNIQDYLS